MTHRIPSAARAFALLALGATAACTVAESQRFSVDPQTMAYAATRCTSALGSYALPKAYLHIRVGQRDAASPPEIMPTDKMKPVEVVRHPDNSKVFCLDHLSSAFADEKITISKWPNSKDGTEKGSMLGAVMVNVTDQTAYIVRALLRALFIATTGAPSFPGRAGEAPLQVIANLEIDPFNQQDMAEANARLTKLGFCLVLKDLGFPADVTIQHYCSAPLRYGRQLTAVHKAYMRAENAEINPRRPGILYRPRMPYRLMIFHKRDPRGRGPWQLSRMMNVNLENLSPVLSLGIERAVFAGKNVNFIFEEGTLRGACVSKTSELQGFVTIPLEIAKSIVAVPASIVAVRIDQIGNRQKLLEAETQLYQIQQAYLVKLAGGDAETPSGPTAAEDVAPFTPGQLGVPDDIEKQEPAPSLNELQQCTVEGLS